ncbi:MAG: hypothetical protein CL609_11440 [Anaerolineaceae bacterium]|nr:hypothetical protein [Anaerolineaceae bacterium]
MANEKDFEFSDDEFDEWEDENESEEKKNKKEKKPKERVQLPIFLELVYSFALIFTILLALVVAGMSYLSGAKWLDVFVRTAITILSTGLLLWIFSLTISNGALKTVKILHQEALEKQQDNNNQNEDAEDEAFSNNRQNMDVG